MQCQSKSLQVVLHIKARRAEAPGTDFLNVNRPDVRCLVVFVDVGVARYPELML